ncbi:hypothetical protein PAXINDRAFT_14769 [Paxillus involutus ATCC 200175]|uniref:DUF6830 domain-containing protein n=1 Tax=Paxillus involutus ATCC 200175 TaxID=664439 RepID=A0A0C9T9Y4_PAXIN|nr:hypothetical protein PAXINDRAFT_14769 [Paxillus involutus ATCC 200175]
MPAECPNCLRQFKDTSSVTWHLSQPRTACHCWQDDLISVAELLNRHKPPEMQPDSPILVLMEDLSCSSDESFDDPARWNEAAFDWDADVEMENGRGITPAQSNIITFNSAAKVYQAGETFLDRFNLDACAPQRRNNIYYPFASRVEWDMAKYLLCSSLSMAKIDEFLKLDLIKYLHLSFRTAKDLQGFSLPTTQVIHLYFHNMLDCIEMLFNHPFFTNKLDLTPQRVYETTEHLSHLPAGATLLGVILSLDKTNITNMTGGQVAHPLLLSLANIKMEHHNKASNHGFLLAALLPVVEFIHPTKRMQTILNDRLIHECLDIVLEPLKQTVRLGCMMSDPVSNLRLCYTPIMAYTVDTPEALMLACVRGLTSHLTLAMFKNFGNPFQHPARRGATTLVQLDSIAIDPDDLEHYFAACKDNRLSSVSKPFWRNWPLAEPSWCLAIVGKKELDFQYSMLQPVVGLCHFKSSVSKLKQVTGRAQHDLQCYIVGVIAGAATPSFVIAIHALSDFCYLSQSPIISEATQEKIKNALQEFHDHKKTIINLGARHGEKNRPLKHWHIPKLELMQSVVPSIAAVGSLLQQEKCRLFDHVTRLSTVNEAMHKNEDVEDDEEEQEDDEDLNEDNTNPAAVFDKLWGSNRQPTNFFWLVSNGRNGPDIWPPRTFLAGSMAVHLNARPSIPRISIDNVANAFSLPDLWAAFADYYHRDGPSFHDLHTFGHPRRAARDAPLCFDDVEVWHKV